MTDTFPMLVNDPAGCERTAAALRTVVGERLIDPGLIAASEDVGELAVAAGVPCVYWLLGGSDPAAFAGATTPEQLMGTMAGPPRTTRLATPRSSIRPSPAASPP